MKKSVRKVPAKANDNQFRFNKKPLAVAISVSALLAVPMANSQGVLEEVIVTATKRETSIIDVPYNISAISGETLRNANVTSLEELARLVPGLALQNAGQKQAINNSMILRGVNIRDAGFNNSLQNVADAPVSMYLGDIPIFTMIRTIDLQRVEVLRGPQGTLYGSGSVGGTVRFIPNRPDTDNRDARVSLGFGVNDHSDEMNYNADFVGNLPINDDFAIRVVGGYEKKGGVTDADGAYLLDKSAPDTNAPSGFSQAIFAPAISDPANPDSSPVISPQEDTDDYDSWYVRGSALWTPTDNVEAVLTLLRQEDNGDGDTVRGVVNDDWEQGSEWSHNMRRVNDGFESRTTMVSLEVTADLGFATLSSSTGHTDVEREYQNDISGLYQFLDDLDFFGPCSPFGSYCGFPRLTAPSPQADSDENFTQEFRLVTDTGENWDAVLGVFYRDQKMKLRGRDLVPGFADWARNPNTEASIAVGTPTVFDTLKPSADFAFELNRDIDYKDIAVFGELTFRPTDNWQLTGGFRAFWQDFEQDLFNELHLIYGPFTAADNTIKQDFDDVLFKLNTSYNLYDQHTAYFTWSEGFRHGGGNGFPVTGDFAVPEQFLTFESESATNWELGLKGELFDSRMRYSAAIFRIDLDNPQRDEFLGPLALPGVVNADEARTQGIELEINARPTDQLSLMFGYNYVDAEFTKDSLSAAPISGSIAAIRAGDPLPGVSEHMFSWSADYVMPLDNGTEIAANINGNYRSDFQTQANATAGGNFADLDGFAIWNASLTWRMNNIEVGSIVRNIGDEEGVTAVRLNRDAFDDRVFVTRPRSYGLFFNYFF